MMNKVSNLSNSFWSGNPPKSDEDAKNRLCMAALQCIKRLGLEKTTMSDIAREAGITRPTLYKHFKNIDELLYTAIDNEAFRFAESVVTHARTFSTIEDRTIETIIYVVEKLPNEPYLSLVLSQEVGSALRERAFSDEATEVFSQMTAEPLIEVCPELSDQGVEISEIMSRFAISMITFPGKFSNDIDSLRALIKRRLLPGLLLNL